VSEGKYPEIRCCGGYPSDLPVNLPIKQPLTVFLSELVRMPPHELERFKASPVFPERIAAVHTIPREFRARAIGESECANLTASRWCQSSVCQKNIEDWHAALPNSQIVELPGQQHIAMDTAPDLFVREVQAFLTELD
jgi:hypothetical protein